MHKNGFVNYFKSASVGNLTTSSDSNGDLSIERPIQSPSPTFRGRKIFAQYKNDSVQEIRKRLNEIAENHKNELDNDKTTCLASPPILPSVKLENLQNTRHKKNDQKQSILWELLVTEQNFLKQLHFIIKIYKNTLELLGPEFFPDLNVNELFQNISEIYEVSLEFWNKTFFPMIGEFEIKPMNPILMKNGFTNIGSILQPYITYCTHVSMLRNMISSLENQNELFGEFTKWALDLPESNNELISDHLSKPFVRLTKYKIILSSLYRCSTDEEKTDIQEMIEKVEKFLSEINEKMEQMNLERRIKTISDKIISYNVVDNLGDEFMAIVNRYCKLDLTSNIQIGELKQIRQLLHEGEMRMRDGVNKILDIKLMLFNDLILICKLSKKQFHLIKVIKPPINLARMAIHKLSHSSFVCVILNEFNCLSMAYCFICTDPRKVNDWILRINKAKENLLTFTIGEGFILRNSTPKTSTSEALNIDCISNDVQEKYSRKRAPVAKKHSMRQICRIEGSLDSNKESNGRKTSYPLLRDSYSMENINFKMNNLQIPDNQAENKTLSKSSENLDELTTSSSSHNVNKSLSFSTTQYRFMNPTRESEMTNIFNYIGHSSIPHNPKLDFFEKRKRLKNNKLFKP